MQQALGSGTCCNAASSKLRNLLQCKLRSFGASPELACSIAASSKFWSLLQRKLRNLLQRCSKPQAPQLAATQAPELRSFSRACSLCCSKPQAPQLAAALQQAPSSVACCNVSAAASELLRSLLQRKLRSLLQHCSKLQAPLRARSSELCYKCSSIPNAELRCNAAPRNRKPSSNSLAL
jgi:hypothetical protein